MKLDQITFSRFIAAMGVVIFHFGQDALPFSLCNKLFSKGDVGVSYFFVLSGFIMMVAYYNSISIDFFTFIKKRLARIYPLYLFAALLMFLLWLFSRDNIDYFTILFQLLMIHAWRVGKVFGFNFPSWSLSVEFFFYILFPFIFILYKRYSLKVIFVVIFMIWILSQMIVINLPIIYQTDNKIAFRDVNYYFPLLHLNQFLIGNFCGLFFLKKKFRYKYNGLIVVLLSIGLIAVLSAFKNININDGILAFYFAVIIYFMASDNGVISKFLSKKPFVLLGEVSYAIYILQFPIYVLVYKIFEVMQIESIEFKFYIYCVLLILTSFLTYYFIEIPSRNFINNIRIKKK